MFLEEDFFREPYSWGIKFREDVFLGIFFQGVNLPLAQNSGAFFSYLGKKKSRLGAIAQNSLPLTSIFLIWARCSGIKFREYILPLLYRNFSSRNFTPESLFLAIIRNLYSWLGIVFLKNSGILIPEKNSSRKIYSQKKSLRKIIPGINLPEECWFLRNSRKTPSLWHL